MLTYSKLFINILYYKNKLYINKLIYNLYIYIYTHESSLNKRVEPSLHEFASFNNRV
jgi:hypothetical protein